MTDHETRTERIRRVKQLIEASESIVTTNEGCKAGKSIVGLRIDDSKVDFMGIHEALNDIVRIALINLVNLPARRAAITEQELAALLAVADNLRLPPSARDLAQQILDDVSSDQHRMTKCTG